LDIGTYSPFAAIAQSSLRKRCPHSRWIYTSHTGETQQYVNGNDSISIKTVPSELQADHLPFRDASFDLVLCTEVVEHLNRHPQTLLVECNRILKVGGFILVSTPNVGSWKKLLQLTNGNWDYDSPTFLEEWGHRYEYTFWQLQQMLLASGFSPFKEVARDVYPDDPRGVASAIQLGLLLLGKMVTLQPSRAAKLFTRKGSSLFFLYRKTTEPTQETPLLNI
jgi:SAM-dependent methyltransferase